MIKQQLNTNLNSLAIVTNRSPRNGSNGVICDTNDGKNGTSIASKSDWITHASDSVIQIDDSDYEVVIEALEADDTTEVENGAPSNANSDEIENDTIITQNTSDAYNFNDGYFFLNFSCCGI